MFSHITSSTCSRLSLSPCCAELSWIFKNSTCHARDRRRHQIFIGEMQKWSFFCCLFKKKLKWSRKRHIKWDEINTRETHFAAAQAYMKREFKVMNIWRVNYFISSPKKNFPSLHWCGDRRRSFLFVKTTLFTPLIFRLSSTLMSRECVFGPSPRVKTSLAFTLQARRRKSDFALKIKLLLCNGHIASTCLHIHSDDANLPALAFFFIVPKRAMHIVREEESENAIWNRDKADQRLIWRTTIDVNLFKLSLSLLFSSLRYWNHNAARVLFEYLSYLLHHFT